MSGITNDLIPVNAFSRPGRVRKATQVLVIHYVGNPGTSAKFNRDYWAGLASGKEGKYASAHFVVGLQGEILRSVPEGEVAYHCGSSQVDPKSGRIYTDWARANFDPEFTDPTNNSPNNASIGIELCHPGADGKFLDVTLDRAAFLAASLCLLYGIDPLTKMARHWDIVGWKTCPLWFVNHEDDWKAFQARVAALVNGGSQ